MFDYAEFSAEFPAFFPVLAALAGAIVGSFLNVVIYRVPAGKSVVSPGSHCACGKPIAWYDNLPVLSWFILRGRARCCGRAYSFRYPFVELLVAGLFLAAWMAHPPAKALVGWVFLSGLVCATFIDFDTMEIPNVFTVGGALTGVILSTAVPILHGFHSEFLLADMIRAGITSVQGMFLGSALVLWIALFAEAILKKDSMGFGDVKFVGAIGAFCGWQGAFFSVFGGAIVGTVWFMGALLWKKLSGRTAPATPRVETADGQPAELGFGVQVPFGPMLAIAAAVYFLLMHRWVDPYLAQFATIFS